MTGPPAGSRCRRCRAGITTPGPTCARCGATHDLARLRRRKLAVDAISWIAAAIWVPYALWFIITALMEVPLD